MLFLSWRKLLSNVARETRKTFPGNFTRADLEADISSSRERFSQSFTARVYIFIGIYIHIFAVSFLLLYSNAKVSAVSIRGCMDLRIRCNRNSCMHMSASNRTLRDAIATIRKRLVIYKIIMLVAARALPSVRENAVLRNLSKRTFVPILSRENTRFPRNGIYLFFFSTYMLLH